MSHDSKIDVSTVSKVKPSTPHQSIESLGSHMLRALDSSKKQNNSAQITSSAIHDLSKPRENDVLLGRGGRGTPTSKHSGNINYRFIIKSYKEYYKSRRNNTEKHSVTREVFHRIKNQSPPCRFMRQVHKTNTWIEIDDREARNKISQALREHEPGRKKGCCKTKSCNLKDINLDCNTTSRNNDNYSDSKQYEVKIGVVTQNDVTVNQFSSIKPSVPDLPALVSLTEDVYSNPINDTKDDVLHHMLLESNLPHSQRQHDLSSINNCATLRDNAEHCQSEVDMNVSEVGVDLSEVDMDLPWLINSTDV